MLPKGKRLTRSDFKLLNLEKTFYHSPHFTLRLSRSAKGVKVGVSVSKKISKKAVVRNKIRRRAYSALREIFKEIKPGMYLLIARSGVEKTKGDSLREELVSLFKKV